MIKVNYRALGMLSTNCYVVENPDSQKVLIVDPGDYTMQADKTVKEGDVLHLADFEIHVLATPGHTAGGVCYYIPAEKALFSGDTLFCESYGRYDFPTSSGRELIASVKRLLKELPGDVTVYPGHNDETTIEHEKRYNPLA